VDFDGTVVRATDGEEVAGFSFTPTAEPS